MDALFVEREIFLRSAGRVRFLRIGRGVQIKAAAALAALLVVWTSATLVMLGLQIAGVRHQAKLARDAAAVANGQAALSAYRRDAGTMVEDLQRRQQAIEQLVTSRLGAPTATPSPAPTPAHTSSLPDRRTLAALAARQDAFARGLATTFDARSADAAAALRRLGLDPDAMLARSRDAQGGPLLPWPPGRMTLTPALASLARSVERFGLLADNLEAVPSGKPTDGLMITSSYGVRSDPFTGAPAFHAGLDFVGDYGQPIRAAATGTVVFIGQRSGYGNVVEVDHGNGILTRYAHLSGFDAHPGQHVARGQQIARMGSTGRSTGTHLHFEVRVDGQPMNPRRFLSAGQELAHVYRQADHPGAADAGDRG